MMPSEVLNDHLRDIVNWHFSPETGTPFWLDWARERKVDPVHEVKTFADLRCFSSFDDDWLRFEHPQRWVPRAFEGRPYNIFETGGTTGMPKQRIGWDDYKHDYEAFGDTLNDDDFPRGKNWLMMGPTGPRRLRLAIEHLANYRGGSCYFVDLDPRWVKKVIAKGDVGQAKDYMHHVVDQALTIIEHRSVSALFTTPKLLEALSEKISIPDAGIRGVFCGGTEMSPQTVRFLVEEVLEGKTVLKPVYGNTLMGVGDNCRSRFLWYCDRYAYRGCRYERHSCLAWWRCNQCWWSWDGRRNGCSWWRCIGSRRYCCHVLRCKQGQAENQQC